MPGADTANGETGIWSKGTKRIGPAGSSPCGGKDLPPGPGPRRDSSGTNRPTAETGGPAAMPCLRAVQAAPAQMRATADGHALGLAPAGTTSRWHPRGACRRVASAHHARRVRRAAVCGGHVPGCHGGGVFHFVPCGIKSTRMRFSRGDAFCRRRCRSGTPAARTAFVRFSRSLYGFHMISVWHTPLRTHAASVLWPAALGRCRIATTRLLWRRSALPQ